MPFTKETAKENGRLGGLKSAGGKIGGLSRSEAKTHAAQQNGLSGGAPQTAACTCGKLPHVNPCPVYMREKKAESRARLKGSQED